MSLTAMQLANWRFALTSSWTGIPNEVSGESILLTSRCKKKKSRNKTNQAFKVFFAFTVFEAFIMLNLKRSKNV